MKGLPVWAWRPHVPPVEPKTPQARVGITRRYQNRRLQLCHHHEATFGSRALYDWVMAWKYTGETQ